MTAGISHGVRLCGRCERLIRAGDPIYFVTRLQLPRCESCAWAMGGPLQEPRPDVRRAEPPLNFDLARFRRDDVAQRVRANVIDWRSKQAGEA